MRRIACIFPLLLLTIPPPARASDRPESHRATLQCGDGLFRLSSETLQGRQAPLAPVRQSLTFTVGGRSRKLLLQQEGEADFGGVRVQRAYVGSWACVKAATGKSYLDVQYNCAGEPGTKEACPDGKEWFHLLDPHGRTLDAGAQDDAARAKLQARLGLSEIMAAGVAMQDVLASP